VRRQRFRTPTLLQMEAVECGAAALGIILGYYGRIVPLEELRLACGVSRDGSKASNVVKAARSYGLQAGGFRYEPEDLPKIRLPVIVFWNFSHFLVVEGFSKDHVYLNDPSSGPRKVTWEEFDKSFTGVVLTFEPGPNFTRGGSRQSLVQALRSRLSGSQRALAFAIIASLGLVTLGMAVPAYTRIYIDKYVVHGLSGWLAPLILLMTITAVLMGILTWLQQFILLKMETKMALAESSKFFWHVLHLPVVFFTQRAAGEISTRVAINDRVATLLSGSLATNALGLVTMVFFVVLMLLYDIPLTIVAIAVAFLNLAALRYVNRMRKDQNQKLLQERGKLMGYSMSGLRIIETLKATGGESDFFARWAGSLAKAMNAEQDLGLSTQLLSAVPPFLALLTTAVILTVGGLRVMDGNLSIGTLVAFQVLVVAFMLPITNLVTLGAQIQEAEGDMNRLDDVLRYPVDPSFRQAQREVPKSAVRLTGYVELRNVTFGYSRLDAPLIEDFSLKIEPGQRVALVGGSGSGKSTVAKLVIGLYEPWSGEIMFDGLRRDEIPSTLVISSLAAATQELSLFEGTIRDNLTMWDRTVPLAGIVQAAKDAQIHEDISARPGGYDSLLEEEGRNFSGGQRQRMEIARALAANPSILVMDEATSALDPLTEKLVDDSVRRRGCTSLIIAHRLSTIRDADEIIVLDNGKVVQRGSHTELRRVDGPYRRLMRAGETSTAPSPLDLL
jgi:NHLM bacteriocin system ABC transporter peptidase/ATP-binding protein